MDYMVRSYQTSTYEGLELEDEEQESSTKKPVSKWLEAPVWIYLVFLLASVFILATYLFLLGRLDGAD